MSREKLHYTNGEVTVVWQPKLCTHSTNCWKGLLAVFNPRVRPWVNMQGASTGQIINQVQKCPSGALSYFLNTDVTQKTAEAPATTFQITVSPNGPYLISSAVALQHMDGHEEVLNQPVALCRCGASQNKPFCDGSHLLINFKG